ncbi:phosphohydrolase [Synergistales bacterium]|nr:phosphohydrolase [Synergistales bacterium]
MMSSSKLMNASDVKKLAAADVFKGIFIVNAVLKKIDKNGKPYWEMTVSDKSGALNAKVWSDAGWWDRSTPELESKPDMLQEAGILRMKGHTAGITGKVADYRGQLQYNFNAISLLNQDKYSPAQYVAQSEIPLPVMTRRLETAIESCRPEIADFLRVIFDGETGRAFRCAPAAVSNHHAYAHGLLEHTLATMDAAKALADVYRGVYPYLDIDVVVAGALLHDIGKTEAYAMSPVPEITLSGAVLDHIAIGYVMFERAAERANLSSELRAQIGHIILSHHGQKEFGSPVLPATPEALIVAAADDLDFRLFCWKDATKDMPPEQDISAFHFAAQRRFWQVHKQSEAAEKCSE